MCAGCVEPDWLGVEPKSLDFDPNRLESQPDRLACGQKCVGVEPERPARDPNWPDAGQKSINGEAKGGAVELDRMERQWFSTAKLINRLMRKQNLLARDPNSLSGCGRHSSERQRLAELDHRLHVGVVGNVAGECFAMH